MKIREIYRHRKEQLKSAPYWIQVTMAAYAITLVILCIVALAWGQEKAAADYYAAEAEGLAEQVKFLQDDRDQATAILSGMVQTIAFERPNVPQTADFLGEATSASAMAEWSAKQVEVLWKEYSDLIGYEGAARSLEGELVTQQTLLEAYYAKYALHNDEWAQQKMVTFCQLTVPEDMKSCVTNAPITPDLALLASPFYSFEWGHRWESARVVKITRHDMPRPDLGK